MNGPGLTFPQVGVLNPIDFLEKEADGGIGKGDVVAEGFRWLGVDKLASTMSLRFSTRRSVRSYAEASLPLIVFSC